MLPGAAILGADYLSGGKISDFFSGSNNAPHYTADRAPGPSAMAPGLDAWGYPVQQDPDVVATKIGTAVAAALRTTPLQAPPKDTHDRVDDGKRAAGRQ